MGQGVGFGIVLPQSYWKSLFETALIVTILLLAVPFPLLLILILILPFLPAVFPYSFFGTAPQVFQ